MKFKHLLVEGKGTYASVDKAIDAAKEKVKKFSDSQSEILVYAYPDKSADVNAELNSQGRNAIMKSGGKLKARVSRKGVKK
jgi:hypothetical protein